MQSVSLVRVYEICKYIGILKKLILTKFLVLSSVSKNHQFFGYSSGFRTITKNFDSIHIYSPSNFIAEIISPVPIHLRTISVYVYCFFNGFYYPSS